MNQILQEVREHNGILPGVYLGLGLIQRFTSRLNEAGESLQKAAAALEADPYLRNDLELRTWIYRNSAEIYYETGRYDQTVATYRELLPFLSKDDKSYWDTLMSLANCYQLSGAYGKAAECFTEVQDSPYLTDSERTAARGGAAWNKAKCCYDSGDFEEAIDGFEDALRNFPLSGNDHTNTLLWLGCVFRTKSANCSGANRPPIPE